MWTVPMEELPTGRGLRGEVRLDGRPASVVTVLRGWGDDAALRARFGDALASAPFRAFRWETPAVTVATLDRFFEFVVLDDPGLDRTPDANAFEDHFDNDDDIVVFPNLGRDALLVVPRPLAPSNAPYGHLAAFVRDAPAEQRDALWSTVAAAMRRRLGSTPVWLSTAGDGVPWLHVRLDDRPKYYAHGPYRRT